MFYILHLLLSCFLFFLECLPITSALACLNIFLLEKEGVCLFILALKIYLFHILSGVACAYGCRCTWRQEDCSEWSGRLACFSSGPAPTRLAYTPK